MNKITSVEEFKSFRHSVLEESENNKPCIVISAGTCGQASGVNDIMRMTKRYILEKDLHDKIRMRITGCLGMCEIEPCIIVEPSNFVYPKVKIDDVPEIIEAAVRGDAMEENLFQNNGGSKSCEILDEMPYFMHQERVILQHNQRLDPIRIFNYLSAGGYAAFEKVLKNPKPEKIIDEVMVSGLRGRGGAGFPTGKKWKMAYESSNGTGKYIVCNADEGDPGAYMDRNLLEGNPHSIIEGMIIGGIATGATKGFIYVRIEYPLAIKHVSIALRQAYDLGILGKNILDSGIDFDIELVRGGGAFVCGEETALIRSIEGKMGQPKQRTPYPVNRGIWGKPTCINNVETLANIPVIINRGGKNFSKIGIPGNTGTKIFSLVGKIKNTGLIEVPLGTTINKVIYDIGGGPRGTSPIKAVQTGGPSGGCIPVRLFDLPIDYESLSQAGTIMGSGGLIVMDEETCMVDIARYYMNFLQEESCGKCSICREGTQRMYDILDKISMGEGSAEDVGLLEELGQVMIDASLCGLGQTAANPVLSTLRYFREEYIEHIEKKKCNAIVCKEIFSSPCQYTCPIDTEVPVYVSLIAHKRYTEALKVIKEENPFSSVLARVCHHPCEYKCKTGDGGDPIAIKDLKRFITDYGLEHNLQTTTEAADATNGIKVAIIGSGPAGLTCGFYLAKKAYDVSVFEKQSEIGGMLALGIPEYRLPRKILDSDLNYIKSAGLEIRTNVAMGVDFTLDTLFEQGYKAVFIATGAHQSIKLNIPGENAEGVLSGMKVLSALNLGEKIEIGKRVGIIGGGNTAVDTARRVLRAESSESIAMVDTARSTLRTTEADSVTIFYRRTINEISAYKEEVGGALSEGIKLEYLTAPVRIITSNEKLKACEFIRIKMGDVDESGRRRPVPIEGSEFIVELDTLIVSISEHSDISFLKDEGLEFSKWDTVVTDQETTQTNRKGIFAGGDLVTGPNTVVDAVATGKLAANSIDQYLSGKKIKRNYKITRPSKYIEPLDFSDDEMNELSAANRSEMPVLSQEKRKYNLKEVNQGLSEKQAIREARRCLRCDLETKDGQKFYKNFLEGKKI